jgi:quinoprotein glucose dehydrogenase
MMEKIDAVIQTTKSGFVYVLNRDTGESLFPVEEKEYPKSDLEGEEAWPTQPLPVKPPAFARQAFTKDMINKLTPEIESFVTEKFKNLRTGGQFIPPSKEGYYFPASTAEQNGAEPPTLLEYYT